jgi:cytochrome b pre-mRNA-processing protein 3
MLNLLGRSTGRKRVVRNLYAATVQRSREPVFFTKLGVPDTLDGRFDLLTLHAWLVLERLRDAGLADLSQGFLDTVFVGFDESFREMGAGDMGMGRRMKKLADAFYGRLSSYDGSADVTALSHALQRNLYRGAGDVAHADTVARYVNGARAHLARCDLTTGELNFGPLP